MANYSFYQPPMMGYQQPVQQQQSGLFCRPVTCLEEVRATPVDFSGSPMVFLDAAHGMAYTKAFNSMTGDSEIIQYRRVAAQQPQTVSVEAFAKLQQTVNQLKSELEAIKNPQRIKEDYQYEQPDRQYPERYPQRRKPYADDYADSAEQPQIETGEQYLARQRRAPTRTDSAEHVQGEGYQPR